MNEAFMRTQLLLGEEAMKRLANSRVAVFGIGGVGGHIAEALVRSGIGEIDIIDNDTVNVTNINRQIFATYDSIGRLKVDVAFERLKAINPDVKINKYAVFYTKENADEFDFSVYDYVVDAIDTVSGKISLIVKCKECGTPIISSMGAGNKLDPTQFEVSDIYKTSVCPLARVMRYELKKRGIKKLKVVYSKEKPIAPNYDNTSFELESTRKKAPGSVAFVPSVVGLIIAGEVIKDLIKS